MLINGISAASWGSTALPQPAAAGAPAPATAPTSTQPVTGVTTQLLSPVVLAELMGQHLSFYGSYYGS
jgi:hypothetical protein